MSSETSQEVSSPSIDVATSWPKGNVYKRLHMSPFKCRFPMPLLFATALFGCGDAVPLAYSTLRTIIRSNYYNSNEKITKQDVTRRVRDPSGRKEDEGGVNPAMKIRTLGNFHRSEGAQGVSTDSDIELRENRTRLSCTYRTKSRKVRIAALLTAAFLRIEGCGPFHAVGSRGTNMLRGAKYSSTVTR
ncbi:hypothetical protein BGZ57DRAFT_861549 [Hyaloscypha finlandica]|nr:hypothetical protein BGZ57DRAFT_861549 [Hyaloscypha finlandica]